jgi:hypothetical protein
VKTVDQLQPNYAPIYAAALYPKLAELFQKHGYALAVHGSLARDFEVIQEMTEKFIFKQIGEPITKQYGRVAYTISVGFGECALDLSFFPKTV